MNVWLILIDIRKSSQIRKTFIFSTSAELSFGTFHLLFVQLGQDIFEGNCLHSPGKSFLNRLYEHRCPSTKQKWQEIQVTWSNSYIQKLAVPCEFDARSPVPPASGAACSSSGSGLWSTTWGLQSYIAIASIRNGQHPPMELLIHNGYLW